MMSLSFSYTLTSDCPDTHNYNYRSYIANLTVLNSLRAITLHHDVYNNWRCRDIVERDKRPYRRERNGEYLAAQQRIAAEERARTTLR
jgi:hypothetical protein